MRLPATARGRQAAELLRPGRHLHLRADAAGFVRGIAALDLWTPTDIAPPELDVSLELADVETFGLERVLAELYFPLFVACAYCGGESDTPVNAETLRRLATPEVLVTVARENGVAVGAALFQAAARTPTEDYDAAELVADGADVVVMATRDPALAEPFFGASLAMLASAEVGAVRVRRSPWATEKNASFWRRDLARTSRLACAERSPGDFFAWQPAALSPAESLLVLERTGVGLAPRVLGAANEDLAACCSRVIALQAPR